MYDFEKKSKVIGFIAYEDSMMDVIAQVISSSDHLDYFISPLHDKDLKDDGTTKKPHYHVVLKFPNQVVPKRWFDMLNVPLNCAEIVKNIDGYLLYFLHTENTDKAQYEYNDIRTSDKLYLQNVFKRINRNEELIELTKVIFSGEISSFTEIISYAIKNNLYETLMTKYFFYKLLIDDINKKN